MIRLFEITKYFAVLKKANNQIQKIKELYNEDRKNNSFQNKNKVKKLSQKLFQFSLQLNPENTTEQQNKEMINKLISVISEYYGF